LLVNRNHYIIEGKKNPLTLSNQWVIISQNLEEEEGVSTSSPTFAGYGEIIGGKLLE